MGKTLWRSQAVWWMVGGLILLVGAPLAYWAYTMTQPHPLDAFAQCLGERGAKFYGAFWCPVCARQKAAFGRAQRLLPYVECSPPSRQGQYPECREKNIRGYPTWIFSDGERLEGLVPLSVLAEKTGCPLPEGYEGR